MSMWKEDGQEEAWGLGIRFLSRRRLATQTLLYDGMVLHAQPETPSLLAIFRKETWAPGGCWHLTGGAVGRAWENPRGRA